jgi:hypothetical protein
LKPNLALRKQQLTLQLQQLEQELELPEQQLEQELELPEKELQLPEQQLEQELELSKQQLEQKLQLPEQQLEQELQLPEQQLEQELELPKQQLELPEQQLEQQLQLPEQQLEQEMELPDQQLETSDLEQESLEQSEQLVEQAEQQLEPLEQQQHYQESRHVPVTDSESEHFSDSDGTIVPDSSPLDQTILSTAVFQIETENAKTPISSYQEAGKPGSSAIVTVDVGCVQSTGSNFAANDSLHISVRRETNLLASVANAAKDDVKGNPISEADVREGGHQRIHHSHKFLISAFLNFQGYFSLLFRNMNKSHVWMNFASSWLKEYRYRWLVMIFLTWVPVLVCTTLVIYFF